MGPIAGWPPHQSVEESIGIIKNVLSGAEAYAICLKTDNKAIGAIELKLNGHTDMTDRDDECELGYWLGKPFWGQGIMPEAARELLRHAFEDIGMKTVWCGYYDGNAKSKRVQEKIGFIYHHTCDEVDVPLMKEVRVGHTSCLTKEQWEKQHITLCGDNCLFCPRYLAKTNEEFREVSELWYKIGWRDTIVSTGEISCSGCSSHKQCTYHLIDCVKEHGVKKCNQCFLFPCEKVDDMLKRSADYKRKLRSC